MNLKLGVFLLFLLLGAGIHSVQAQWKIAPLAGYSPHNLTNARTYQEHQDTIQVDLPFWDDFAAADTIDSDLWRVYENVEVGSDIAVNPPSINYVTFNGANASGAPYSSVQGDQGKGDSLVSNFIRLDKVPAEQRNTVFLSFFWQAGGLGERPDEDDSLVLEFRSNLNRWYSVKKLDPSEITASKIFEQELIAVQDQILTDPAETFFHPYFQFRFTSHNLLNGTFDNWHIDYVYLDQGRDMNDLAYFDRAMATAPTFLFDGFGAVPMVQLMADPQRFTGRSRADFYNLSDEGFQSLEFSAFAEARFSNGAVRRIDTMNFRTPLDPLPDAFERRTLEANPFDISSLQQFEDSAEFELWNTFILNSGDTVLQQINYRHNDTARSKTMVGEYFAYDDGSAEFGVGIRQSGGKVAYQFVMSEPDTLTEIDINFPRIGPNLEGTGLRLYVWRNLNENVQTTMVSQEAVIRYPAEKDGFFTYKLGRPVVVRDTFYIGYEQFTDEFMAVGFDKNNDSQEHIFYSIAGDGAWEQFDETAGSLLMRPRFGRAILTSVKQPEPISPESQVRVWPNPASDVVYLQGDFDRFELINLAGNQLLEAEKRNELAEINLSGLPAGIYLVKLYRRDQVMVSKVVVK